jgi:hypothetical protein
MAKLNTMPGQVIVDGLAGTVDFYLWRGIPVARKWPRCTAIPRTSGEQLAAAEFAYINKQASSVPQNLRAQYNELAAASSLTWKDWLTRLYLSGSKTLPDPRGAP